MYYTMYAVYGVGDTRVVFGRRTYGFDDDDGYINNSMCLPQRRPTGEFRLRDTRVEIMLLLVRYL